MSTRSLLVSVAVVCTFACAVGQAGVILLYTSNTWENGPGIAGELPDDKFQDWLITQLGHTVVRKTVTSGLTSGAMQNDITTNGASLVIIGPRNSSGNYTDKTINTAITTPILALLPHAIRSDRLDWTSAGTGGDNVAWTTYDWLQPSDPRVNGIGTTVMTYPTGVGSTRWSLATYDALFNVVGAGQGQAIGGRTGTSNAEFMEWLAGQSLDGGQVTAGDRVYFGITNWAATTGGTPAYNTFDIATTADGKHVLARIVNDLIAGQVTSVTAVPGGPYTVLAGGGATLFDGTGSSTSGSGTITAYEWDFNNDGLADLMGVSQLIDYAYLSSTLGMTDGPHAFSLTVRTNDYEVGTALGTLTLSTAVIPEPTTLCLLGFGALGLLARGSRRGHRGKVPAERARI